MTAPAPDTLYEAALKLAERVDHDENANGGMIHRDTLMACGLLWVQLRRHQAARAQADAAPPPQPAES